MPNRQMKIRLRNRNAELPGAAKKQPLNKKQKRQMKDVKNA